MTGDKERDVFVQDILGVKILDAQGHLLHKPLPSPIAPQPW
ncbi:MAG: hypothetical protein U0401_08505 [Anaerolineae bacterium]